MRGIVRTNDYQMGFINHVRRLRGAGYPRGATPEESILRSEFLDRGPGLLLEGRFSGPCSWIMSADCTGSWRLVASLSLPLWSSPSVSVESTRERSIGEGCRERTVGCHHVGCIVLVR